MTATLGIDIASRPKRTAIARIEWEPHAVTLEALHLGAIDGRPLDDEHLVELMRDESVTKVGIDAPFGWPKAFTQAVTAYAGGGAWPSAPSESREHVYRRQTDAFVHQHTKRPALAVSVDKIGYCAIRTAVLLTSLGGAEANLRDGTGRVCEVYPSPALRHWTKDSALALEATESYKGKDRAPRRASLLDALLEELPIRDPHGLFERMRTAPEDDYLDAFICALVARAAEQYQTVTPDEAEVEWEVAREEGWIHLPDQPLRDLTADPQ